MSPTKAAAREGRSSMKTKSSVALGGLLVLALAGCGGAERAAAPRETVTVTAPAPSPLSAAPTTATPSLEPAPTASESPSTAPGATTPLAGDAQKDLVTRLAATAVKNARPELLTAIKDDPRVEAVERFEFDRRDRTLRLQVASVFRSSDEARDSLAYQLASGAAPLLWDPSIAGQGGQAELPAEPGRPGRQAALPLRRRGDGGARERGAQRDELYRPVCRR